MASRTPSRPLLRRLFRDMGRTRAAIYGTPALKFDASGVIPPRRVTVILVAHVSQRRLKTGRAGPRMRAA